MTELRQQRIANREARGISTLFGKRKEEERKQKELEQNNQTQIEKEQKTRRNQVYIGAGIFTIIAVAIILYKTRKK
tara:strand:+ start:1060 stop:1287 length:228 start_codon:yes stop_codon:yes gene_type:complete